MLLPQACPVAEHKAAKPRRGLNGAHLQSPQAEAPVPCGEVVGLDGVTGVGPS